MASRSTPLRRDSSSPTQPHAARHVQSKGPFRRLVSLVPSTTETLFALGAGDRLVGVTDYCVRPDPMPSHVIRIGGPKDPDLALIRTLAPDLVLADREENRAADVMALAEWTQVHVADLRTVVQAIAEFGVLGRLLDRPEPARTLAERAQTAVLAVRDAARPYRYVYLVWRDPWMAAGPDTYVSDVLLLGGGANAVPPATESAPRRYPVVDLVQVAQWQPDHVFLPDEPCPFDRQHLAEVEAQLTGRWQGRCWLVSGADFCWPGARMIQGLENYRTWLALTEAG